MQLPFDLKELFELLADLVDCLCLVFFVGELLDWLWFVGCDSAWSGWLDCGWGCAWLRWSVGYWFIEFRDDELWVVSRPAKFLCRYCEISVAGYSNVCFSGLDFFEENCFWYFFKNSTNNNIFPTCLNSIFVLCHTIIIIMYICTIFNFNACLFLCFTNCIHCQLSLKS